MRPWGHAGQEGHLTRLRKERQPGRFSVGCDARRLGGVPAHRARLWRESGRMMHGKASLIKHYGKDLFEGMPNPFPATRYYSLVIERASVPDCLEVTAQTEEREIVGVRHRQHPIWGVQFHPESILTENGRQILSNFLKLGPVKTAA